MRQVNWNHLLCRVCLGTLILVMCAASLRMGCRALNLLGFDNAFIRMELFDFEGLNMNANSAPSVPAIDWEALYPFDVPPAHTENAPESPSVLEKWKQIVGTLKARLRAYSSTKLLGYYLFNELANSYEGLLRWNYVSIESYNAVVKLPDGHLTTYTTRRNISVAADATITFARYCAEKGAKFLYVNAPHKVCRYEDADISGSVDFANQNADAFLNALNDAGVETYDLRETIHDEKLNHHSLFYRTDHHWLGETGFWASRHILQRLRDDLDDTIDVSALDEAQFRKETYPEWFLGSHGKKVTLALTKPDDFSLLYPLYPTEVHFEIPTSGLDVTGDFSVLYDMRALNERDYYGKNPYGAYTYGNRALERIENKKVDNHIRALFVHDSFGNPVTPFLAMGIQFVDSLNLHLFTGSVERYVEETKPDIVIVLYCANNIPDDENSSVFDFK